MSLIYCAFLLQSGGQAITANQLAAALAAATGTTPILPSTSQVIMAGIWKKMGSSLSQF